MDIEDIKKVMHDNDLDFYAYERPKIKDIGNGMMGFVSSGNFTNMGKMLVSFANAIEAKSKELSQ